MVDIKEIEDKYFRNWSRDEDTDTPNGEMMTQMGALMGALGEKPEAN